MLSKHTLYEVTNHLGLLFFLQGSHKGLSLLDKVYNFLNLEEKDYFGLRYLDLSDQTVSLLFVDM